MNSLYLPDFETKQFDTARSLTYTLNVGNQAVDLTSATASLNIQTPTLNILNRSVTVVSASAGVVRYDFVSDDTRDVGLYRMEFKIAFNDGTIIRIPTVDWIYMNVSQALGS